VKRAVMMKIISNIARAISNRWKVSLNSFLLITMIVRMFPDDYDDDQDILANIDNYLAALGLQYTWRELPQPRRKIS
jgi:hypothetical protein